MSRRSLKPSSDVPEIVRRYLDGESMTKLAQECGTSRRTIYNWFLTELGDAGYRQTVTECLVSRVADADQELDDASRSGDPVRVGAAREVCKFVRTDLERRRPALYGAKQTNISVVDVSVNPALLGRARQLLNETISRRVSRVVEAVEVEQVSDGDD